MQTSSNNDIEAITQAEHKLAEAHLLLDINSIDALLHPDYVVLQPDGRIETKADILASYRTGQRRWYTASSDQLSVRLHKDTAVVTGRWQASGQNGEKHFDYTARFLSIWIRENGKWKNIAYQSVEISPY